MLAKSKLLSIFRVETKELTIITKFKWAKNREYLNKKQMKEREQKEVTEKKWTRNFPTN